jgi:hypothetical protein
MIPLFEKDWGPLSPVHGINGIGLAARNISVILVASEISEVPLAVAHRAVGLVTTTRDQRTGTEFKIAAILTADAFVNVPQDHRRSRQ